MSRRRLNTKRALSRVATTHQPKTTIDTPEVDHVARINGISTVAKTSWFGLMSYLAFVGVTLLGVQDADFFFPERETALPLIGVTIPTLTFFWTAPALGMLLYAYLHIYLVKLWDYLADAPPLINKVPLGDAIAPWLLSDFALQRRPDHATPRRPLRGIANLATLSFAFLAGPLVLGYMWYRSMPRHDEWLTIFGCGVPFTLTLYACFQSLRALRRRMAARDHHDIPYKKTTIICSVVLVATIGWFTTEGTLDNYRRQYLDWGEDRIAAAPIRGTDRFLIPADLTGVQFTQLPEDWLPYDKAHSAFEVTWCARHDIPAALCPGDDASLPKPVQTQLQQNWCANAGLDTKVTACASAFDTVIEPLPDSFQVSWREKLAALPTRDLIHADLRNGNLIGAQLQGANLRWTQLQGVILRWAQLQGADLAGAQLRRADLTMAQLQGADLGQARLQGANLAGAQLQGADLRDAELQWADLWGAQLQGADLWLTQFQGANLTRAQLQGADLTGAQFDENTDLSAATLRGAALRSVYDTAVAQLRPFWQEIFADGTVMPDDPNRPDHWATEELDLAEFERQWHAWQDTLSDFDPGWRRP